MSSITATKFRFYSRLRKNGNCIEWNGKKNSIGYGTLKVNRRAELAHRLSWKLHRGDIPDNLLVLHDCDNRICVNTSHLHLGTQSDNIKECYERQRRPRPVGELGSAAKLTWVKVAEIREKYSSGNYHPIQLANEYGVKRPTIQDCIAHRTWKL